MNATPERRTRSLIASLAITVVALFLLNASAASAMTASSTFASGDEGWRWVQDFSDPSILETPTFVSTGGNPGGFIRATDTTDFATEPNGETYAGVFLSPESSPWTDDASANYGGSLTFDMRVDSTPEYVPAVLLFSGSHSAPTSVLYHWDPGDPLPSTSSFTGYSVGLTPESFTDMSTGFPPSESEFRALLADLAGVMINTDSHGNPGEVNDLDNVVLSEDPPLPPDTDGDGVPDSQDACREEPGPASNEGCPVSDTGPAPDTDGDGVPDASDACPTVDGPPASNGCPVKADLVAPEATITKDPPKKTSKSTVKFKFESNEAGSTFECKKDKKPWKDCTSPTKMKRLDEGKHKFQVRAIDPAGNVGAPDKDKFKVVG